MSVKERDRQRDNECFRVPGLVTTRLRCFGFRISFVVSGWQLWGWESGAHRVGSSYEFEVSGLLFRVSGFVF